MGCILKIKSFIIQLLWKHANRMNCIVWSINHPPELLITQHAPSQWKKLKSRRQENLTVGQGAACLYNLRNAAKPGNIVQKQTYTKLWQWFPMKHLSTLENFLLSWDLRQGNTILRLDKDSQGKEEKALKMNIPKSIMNNDWLQNVQKAIGSHKAISLKHTTYFSF